MRNQYVDSDRYVTLHPLEQVDSLALVDTGLGAAACK